MPLVRKNYRAMMMQKKEQNYKGKTGILSYLISILTVIVLCTVSVILLGSIRRMENMEQTISVMSIAMESTEEEKEAGSSQVAVETISGNVLPLEDVPVNTGQQPESAAKEERQPENVAEEEEPESEKEEEQTETSDNEPPVLTEAEKYLAQGYYIVQAGDSLRQICYNIYQTHAMMDALCEANSIEDQDTIYAGQKIILPK